MTFRMKTGPGEGTNEEMKERLIDIFSAYGSRRRILLVIIVLKQIPIPQVMTSTTRSFWNDAASETLIYFPFDLLSMMDGTILTRTGHVVSYWVHSNVVLRFHPQCPEKHPFTSKDR